MEEYFSTIKSSAVFYGAADKTVRDVLSECGYSIKVYNKDDVILLAQARAESIGIILKGQATAQKYSVAGHSFTVTQIKQGCVFGDILAGSHVLSPVTIYAQTACTVFFLPFASLMDKCVKINGAGIILKNLVSTISDKYFALDTRLDLLLEKSLRARIYSYIKEKAAPKGSFNHKLTRQQLADYLGCERTALCRELSRMKNDGVIAYDKKSFTILK